jgi:hypothetical protein
MPSAGEIAPACVHVRRRALNNWSSTASGAARGLCTTSTVAVTLTYLIPGNKITASNGSCRRCRAEGKSTKEFENSVSHKSPSKKLRARHTVRPEAC